MTAPPPRARFSRLLHLGNVVVDLVLDVPGLPERGGDMLASRTELLAGGGFNVLSEEPREESWGIMSRLIFALAPSCSM